MGVARRRASPRRQRDPGARAFSTPAGVRLGLGVEADGVEGFRQSHLQAVKAARAASRTDRSVTRYDEFALEAMAAENETEARSFIARELRGLDGADARSQRLRETLRAYFAAGRTLRLRPLPSGCTNIRWLGGCRQLRTVFGVRSRRGGRSSRLLSGCDVTLARASPRLGIGDRERLCSDRSSMLRASRDTPPTDATVHSFGIISPCA